jgi:hypothetical protein
MKGLETYEHHGMRRIGRLQLFLASAGQVTQASPVPILASEEKAP